MKKIDAIGVRGPVNGMGESDLRGSYFAVSVTFEDDEFVRGRITLAQMETLRDLCNHFISVNS
jgi:hypothetical protein